MILGKNKARKELEEEFERHPPLLYGKELKLETQGTYLGDEIGISVSDSTSLTINKRIGLVKKSIFEIKCIIEDCRSQVAGGIQSGILLWESCVLPFLLNNCSTWLDMKQADMNKLIKIQNLFLNVLLGTYKCPAIMMYWDLHFLVMPLRIMKAKLNLFHHISCLPEQALSHQILLNQQRLKLPGLQCEVESFLNKYEVTNIRSFTKQEWKVFVKDKIISENREYLLKWSEQYKKVDSLSLACEEFEIKPYFFKLNLAQSRLKFRERSKCMKFCRPHYPSDELNRI